jgi:colanic acid biosynthesis glycosyl transferase WcaI
VVIWSPNYAPELIGIPVLVTDAAEWLASRGHRVDVVTALPNYPDRRIFKGYEGRVWRSGTENGVHVHRCWLRVRPGESFFDKCLYELSFAAVSAPRALPLIRRADVVLCVVPTLLTAGLGTVAARVGKTRVVVWVQDLVLAAARSVTGVGTLERSALAPMRAVESLAARSGTSIVTCSEGFVPYMVERGAPAERVTTIPNWVDVDRFHGTVEPPARDGVRFLYTGNIGYTQGFETLFAAVERAGVGLTVEIVGGGNYTETAKRLAPADVKVRPAVPSQAYPGLLASAHALVVVQRGVAANANLPSKIASYLAAGRPIVASIGLDTPAARLLDESRAALVVPPEDPNALAQAMRRIRDDSLLRHELGRRGRVYAARHLAREEALTRLEDVVIGRRKAA